MTNRRVELVQERSLERAESALERLASSVRRKLEHLRKQGTLDEQFEPPPEKGRADGD